MPTPKNLGWVNKSMLEGVGLVIVVLVVLIGAIFFWQYASYSLVSQIQQDSNLLCNETVPVKAVNKYSGEIKEFPNSCVFPRGWTKLSTANQAATSDSGLYRNLDYGFALKVTPDFQQINYGYNGKVDYVGVYFSNNTNDGIFINPKGGQDLLVPDGNPKERSTATLAGKNVIIKKWDLPAGRSLVRYVFKDRVNNWSNCPDAENPTIDCNRIDIYASNSQTQAKLVEAVANISFFNPTSVTTSATVYYYAAGKLHIYNPNTDSETTKSLPGLTNFASIKKFSDNQLVYLNNDAVSTFDFSTGRTEVLFSRNTENGITYVPDSFALSADDTKIAIGYRHGTDADVNACAAKCKNVSVGILVLDLVSGLTKGSFDIPVLASPVAWDGQEIVLRKWDNSGYSAVSQSGTITNKYSVPSGLIKTGSTATNTALVRDDLTAAVALRTQQDRFGSASYLFVNGKVVYKGDLASIDLVGN